MRVMLLVCQQCKHEERIEIHTREEAERDKRTLVPVRCSKCGSTNVRLYEK